MIGVEIVKSRDGDKIRLTHGINSLVLTDVEAIAMQIAIQSVIEDPDFKPYENYPEIGEDQ